MIMAILQARTGSTRLPGKVLSPILGRAMLALQVERVLRAGEIDELVLATTVDPADDPIEQLAGESGVGCFRGSVEDVLDRFYQAALSLSPEHVVRLTGDCPLIDPVVIDLTVARHLQVGVDYTSNTLDPTYPDGLDVEVFRFEALAEAWRDARKTSEREHVTPFLYNHPERFQTESVRQDRDLSEMRWTVDQPEDLAFVRAVYEDLYPANAAFSTDDILSLLQRRPELGAGNANVARNEGYARSVRADAEGEASETES